MTNTSRRAFLSLTGAAVVGVGLAGCSLIGAGNTADGPAKVNRPLNKSRTLVAYFSMPETDAPNNMSEEEAYSTVVIDGKVLGNTQYVAQLIGARTGAKLFRIETAKKLPLDHGELEDISRAQQGIKARPKLKAVPPNLDAYETVFIGYPIWWYDMPMPIYTFLEQNDFSGKNIILFCTHGSSGLGGTVGTVTKALSDSTVLSNGFEISRDDMDSADRQVRDWLASIT
ncbi:flavodoxin [Streptomyces sp. 5-6(2022)]|uniref:flavodoxin n=1 Tax=Streptomyces sp. 5-6(2022) TaxID=2936510 RepID=UPI0023B91912|nr:flavodoxin [Streptomyces sp. 5-6(2022)]